MTVQPDTTSELHLLTVAVDSVYFQYTDYFYTQKQAFPMGSSFSSTLTNVYKKWFETECSVNVPTSLNFGLGMFMTLLWFGLTEEIIWIRFLLNVEEININITVQIKTGKKLSFLNVLTGWTLVLSHLHSRNQLTLDSKFTGFPITQNI